MQGDSYDNKTFSGRFGANLTDKFDIGVVTRYIETSLRFTGDDVLGPESLKSTETDEQLFTRGTAHLVSLDGILDQTVGFAYSKFNQRDFDPNPPSPLPSFFNGDRRKADWQADVKLMPGRILTFRVEHQRDEITTPLQKSPTTPGWSSCSPSLASVSSMPSVSAMTATTRSECNRPSASLLHF